MSAFEAKALEEIKTGQSCVASLSGSCCARPNASVVCFLRYLYPLWLRVAYSSSFKKHMSYSETPTPAVCSLFKAAANITGLRCLLKASEDGTFQGSPFCRVGPLAVGGAGSGRCLKQGNSV